MKTLLSVFYLSLLFTLTIGIRFDEANQFLILESSLYKYRQHPSYTQERVSSYPEDLSHTHQIPNELTHERNRRAINDDDIPANSNINNTNVTIQENHNLAYIAWSGKSDSETMVMLFRDSVITTDSTSAVYVSHDYGSTFTNQTSEFFRESNKNVRIDYFIDSPDDYKDYIFVSQEDRAIYTSQDEANTFHYHPLTFTPSDIITHPHTGDILVAYDETDQQAYISLNFGENWKSFSSLFPDSKIGGVYWGAEFGQNDTIYVAVSQNGEYNISRTDLHLSYSSPILSFLVYEFDIASEYMYAVRIKHDAPDSKLLLVSFDGGVFLESEFSSAPSEGQANLLERSYYIADGSEGQLIVAVNHEYNLTNLYISETRGISFSLSLERVLYHDPNLTDVSSDWVYRARDSKLLDFHKAAGLRGIYIATQLTVGPVGGRYLNTFISYDKGGEWNRLTPPDYKYDNTSISCDPPDCYLNLASEFSSIYRTYQTEPILSASSTPGLIMATGSTGKNLYLYGDLMVSNTAGATWISALPGFTYYTFGDNGGFMLAAHKYYHGHVNYIYYSLDEGVNWQRYVFSEQQSLLIWGIATEPGEYTTVISLYGSVNLTTPIEWVIVKLDLHDLLGPNCIPSDFYLWSPSDDIPDRGCLLGTYYSYERKKVTSHCNQGTDYSRRTTSHLCPCTRIDYECDFGFALEEDESCLLTGEGTGSLVPVDCYPGSSYFHTRGYRKVAGDKCTAVVNDQFVPVEIPCPGQNTGFSVSVGGEGVQTDSIWYSVATGQKVLLTAHFDDEAMINQTNHTFLWRIDDTISHSFQNSLYYTFISARSYIVDITVSSFMFTSTNSTRITVLDSIAPIQFSAISPSYTFVDMSTQFSLVLPVNSDNYGSLMFHWIFGSDSSTSSLSPATSYTFSEIGTQHLCWQVENAVSNTSVLCTSIEVYSSLKVTGLSVPYTGVFYVQLEWNQLTVEFKGYQVLYRENGGSFMSAGLLLNTSFFIVPNLKPSTEYTFAVRAYTDTQYGPLSDSVMCNTSKTHDPPPRDLSVTSSNNGNIIVTWSAPLGSTASKFELFISNSTHLSTEKLSSLTYTLTPPDPGVLYTFQVAAEIDRDTDKYGSLTDPISILSGNKLTNDAPSQFTARPSSRDCLLLTWSPLLYPNFTPVNPDYYEISYYLSVAATLTKHTRGDVQSYTLCDLTTSLYSLQIRAGSDNMLPGPYSPLITAQTVYSSPDAPHNVVITSISSSALQVRWNPPTTASASFYYIIDISHCSSTDVSSCCYSTDSAMECCPAARVLMKVSVAVQEVQLSNLNGDYTYQIVIVAKGSDTYCSHSAAYPGITNEGVPSPPYIVDSSITDTTVILVWSPPEQANGMILGYQVISYIGEVPVLNSYDNRLPLTGQTQLENLWPGFQYTFYLRANTSQGYGMTSLPRSVISPSNTDLIPFLVSILSESFPTLTIQDLEDLVMSISTELIDLGDVFSALQFTNNSIAFLFKPNPIQKRSDGNIIDSVASKLKGFSYEGSVINAVSRVDVSSISSAINHPITPIDVIYQSSALTIVIILLLSIILNFVFLIFIFCLGYFLYRSNKLRKQRYATLTHFNADEEEITLDDPMIQAENLMISNPTNTSRRSEFTPYVGGDQDDDELILDENSKDDTPLL